MIQINKLEVVEDKNINVVLQKANKLMSEGFQPLHRIEVEPVSGMFYIQLGVSTQKNETLDTAKQTTSLFNNLLKNYFKEQNKLYDKEAFYRRDNAAIFNDLCNFFDKEDAYSFLAYRLAHGQVKEHQALLEKFIDVRPTLAEQFQEIITAVLYPDISMN